LAKGVAQPPSWLVVEKKIMGFDIWGGSATPMGNKLLIFFSTMGWPWGWFDHPRSAKGVTLFFFLFSLFFLIFLINFKYFYFLFFYIVPCVNLSR
jgi:hypothetical protein